MSQQKGITNDMHINTWKQTIIVTGGVLVMFMYKHAWRYFGRGVITDTESILVVFFGAAVLIYISEIALNSKMVTSPIF